MSDHSNPYAPPSPDSVDMADALRRRRWTSSSWALLGLSVAVFAATLGFLVAFDVAQPGFVGFGAASIVALAGAWAAIRPVRTLTRATGTVSVLAALLAVAAIGANLLMAGTGALAALLSTTGFRRGRQIRRFGRVLLPRVVSGASWARLDLRDAEHAENADLPLPDCDGDPELAQALAAQWRENGRTEHASVAAFARLTLDLMALGAPPALVASANRDALDEIHHAELCFGLARALDGRAESPDAFPQARSRTPSLPSGRTMTLALLAVDSLVDGALHEGVSARIIARLTKRCGVPEIRAMLKTIAADEGRHAAHGWDVVEWCVAEGGAPVVHALRGAVLALPKTIRSPLPDAAKDGAWEPYGIHGHALEADEYARTRDDIVRRVERWSHGDARAA